MTGSSVPRRYRLWRDGRLALELVNEPGILVSTSAPPPIPGRGPVTHPFATATAHVAEWEGQLGTLLREAADLDEFLTEVAVLGYTVEEVESA
ncbi:MAG: hypothetical protein A2V85_04515 [Chloroflexi bacterium RBG_16_72_14]|nr:MAG: hypothetical protein A2V85_04515 [Chloroflexi bacterium RBG_16_72_14]